MMGRLSASLLLLSLLVGGLAACGGGDSSDLLPGTTASQINSNLDQVERLAAEGECVGAEDAAAEVSAEVAALGGIDVKLKAALREGAERLREVVEGCEEESEEAEPSLETAVEPEEVEKEKGEKPAKEKPGKEGPEEAAEEPAESDEGPTLPPQANGKGEENGSSEGPPVESGEGTPSGGIGPGSPAGED